MKKVFLLLTMLAVMTSTMTAQRAYLNVKGGLNGVYNVGDADLQAVMNDPGYQFGAEFGFKFFKILGFRGEANYVNNKFTITTDRTSGQLPDGSTGSYNIQEIMNVVNNGIQIPTSLTLDLGMLDLNVGPNFQFLLSSIASGSLTNLDSLAQTYDINYDFFEDAAGEGAYFDQLTKDGDYFSMFNVGLNLGLGVNLGGIRLDLKTNYQVTDAINDYYQSSQGEAIDRPINFQLSAVFQVFDFKLFGSDDDDDDGEVKTFEELTSF